MKKVFSYIEQYQMIKPDDRVIVGFSGGADSVGLLLLLKEYQTECQKKSPEKNSFLLEAVHVNHQIRGEEANRDETFAKDLCESLGVSCSCYSYPVLELAKKQHLTEEEAGRMVRHRAFETQAKKAKETVKIALAHHRDDLAETMIHNLVRGTGIGGMAGIRPVTEINGISYIRPLLCVEKEEIKEWLENKNQLWVEDSTNKEASYTRNKIRQNILPQLKELNEKAVLHLANAAETFLMAEEYIGRNADMMYNRYVICKKDRTIIKQGLFQEDRLMQSYVIQRAVSETAGKKKDIGMLHVKLIQELEKKQSGSRISLIYGITVWQNYGDICLTKGELEKKSEIELKMEVFPYENMQIQEKKYTKWFDYDKIKEIPCVRKRQAGDFLTVTKEGGRKKLKDYLIDCKVPRQERDSLTVLADGSHILWVVGYRISEYYKVTEKTKTVIRVHVKGESEDE